MQLSERAPENHRKSQHHVIEEFKGDLYRAPIMARDGQRMYFPLRVFPVPSLRNITRRGLQYLHGIVHSLAEITPKGTHFSSFAICKHLPSNGLCLSKE